MTGAVREGLYFQRGAVGDGYVSRVLTTPDYTAGDAQFLDDARPHEVQLRPILPSERTPRSSGKYPRGARQLVFKPLMGLELRAIVFLPSRHRGNTPENVRLAVREVSRFDKGFGRLFELALAGQAVLAVG